MKLYIGDYNLSSWSLRPWLALTHGQIPFETEVIPLDRPESKARLAAISPSGRVPALQDGALLIWESLAICEYAAERSKIPLWPEDPAARALARAVSCEMHAGFANLRSQHPMRLAQHTPKPPSPEVQRDLDRIYTIWCDLRRQYGAFGPWLFGSFSIADAMFAPVCSRIRTYALPTDETAKAYVESMFSHPGVCEWSRRAEAEIAAT